MIEQAGLAAHCPVDPAKVDLQAMMMFSYGLYVVTGQAGGKQSGAIVNTALQVALEPCQVSVSLNKKSLTHDLIRDGGAFALTILEQDTPLTFIGNFGFRTGREHDKFAKVNYTTGETGCPVVMDHALAVVEARVRIAVDCGSHTTFVGDVVASRVVKSGQPLTYAYYHQIKGGKTGKGAPTYGLDRFSSDKEQRSKEMKKYVCAVCGYVYDPAVGDPDSGIPAGTPFEKLPDDWVCPVCGASKDQFEPES